MMPAITNASKLTVAQAISPMPSGRSTLLGWFRPLDLTKITKETVDYETREIARPFAAVGIWQPFTSSQLSIRPAGERSWRWFMIHTTTDVVLKTDDVIARNGEKYRVMGKDDWSDNNFVHYQVVNAYDAQLSPQDA